MVQSKRYKWKWSAVIFIAVVVLFLGLGWYYSRNWKETVRAKLTERIEKSTQGLYKLTYDDMEVNLLLGDITLKNAELTSDSAIYRQLTANEQASDNRFHIKLSSLEITGFSLWNALVSKKLNISRVFLRIGDFHLIREPQAYNDNKQSDEDNLLYDKIKEVFKVVTIGEIVGERINFKLSKLADGQSDTLAVDSIHITVSDFLLDERSVHDSTRLWYAKGIVLNIPNFEYDIPNSVYKVQFDLFHIDSKSRQATFKKIALVPRISKSAYFQTDKENKALITLKFDSLHLEDMDLSRMMAQKLFYSKYAYIKGGSALFQKDKRYQKDNVLKIGQAPHQQVMKFDQLLQFDTIFVEGVDISYSEHSAKYDQVGTITFEQAVGNITNFTNDTVQLVQDKFMRANLRAKVMGAGLLRAQFSFDMLSEIGSHTYKGTLGQMPAAPFNGILTPLLNLEFASGNIHRISFDMQGTDYRNWGEFRFDYDDARINLLHKSEEGNKGSKKDVLSFLINQFLVNDSNPDPDGTYRIAQVDHTRVPEYSHFKTIWKALFEGIQQCVGLSKTAKVVNRPTDETIEEQESKNIFEKTGDFLKGLFDKKEK